MAKILITGGSGFVGSNLARFFASRNSVAITYFQSAIPTDLEATTQAFAVDIRDSEAVTGLFSENQPDWVIHAAGNKNVRECERQPEEAEKTNVLGTENIAKACYEYGSKLVYISTDLVFDCATGNYQENTTPEPTLVYGKTKLAGERKAQNILPNVAICRSGGIYGKASPLLKWLTQQLQEEQVVECFTDVYNTPTYAENLAEMIEVVMQQNLTGIFHTVGCDRVNRFELFQTYARIFGLNTDLIKAVEAGDRKTQLLLQADASLSITQTTQKLGIPFNSVSEGMQRLKAVGGV